MVKQHKLPCEVTKVNSEIGFIVYLRNKYDTDALTVLIEVITLVLQIC